MKMKKKGKVYPSPSPLPPSSSSSPSHHINEDDSLSVLKLLPATILVLVSVLSAEDREVLAYLIARGTTISAAPDSNKNYVESRKNHKPPVFDCECFDCYTNFWYRWDSSPSREVIHEIIEAFENHHISNSENSSASRKKSKRSKKKEKLVMPKIQATVSKSHVSSSEILNEDEVSAREPGYEEMPEEEVATATATATATTGHKGLARKLLPDVLGLFNSNFWRLWNPNP